MNRPRNPSPRGWVQGQIRRAALFWIVFLMLPTICLGAVQLAPILCAIEAAVFLYWLIRRLKARRR